MRPIRITAVLLVAGLVVVAGCGDYPRSEVHGTITFRGRPLGDATLIFITRDNMTYPADLKSDGTYKVSGIPQGAVRVSIQQHLPHVAPRPEPKYQSRAKANVGESKDKDEERIAPASTPTAVSNPIPPVYTDPDKSGLKFELKDSVQEWSTDLK